MDAEYRIVDSHDRLMAGPFSKYHDCLAIWKGMPAGTRVQLRTGDEWKDIDFPL